MSDGIKILKIAKQGKKYRVETSEGEHLLTEDTLIKFLVRKDASYSEAEFKEILKHDEENRLFERVLRYLAQQSRSENEVRNTCLNTGRRSRRKIILRLKALNYLDDRLFAQNLFNYAVIISAVPAIWRRACRKAASPSKSQWKFWSATARIGKRIDIRNP